MLTTHKIRQLTDKELGQAWINWCDLSTAEFICVCHEIDYREIPLYSLIRLVKEK